MKERGGERQRLNFVLFYTRKKKKQINSSCADESRFFLCAVQQGSCRLQNIPLLNRKPTLLYVDGALSSQPSSCSSLMSSKVNESFSLSSRGECLWLLPGFLPNNHILLAAISAIQAWQCNERSPFRVETEFVHFKGVVQWITEWLQLERAKKIIWLSADNIGCRLYSSCWLPWSIKACKASASHL